MDVEQRREEIQTHREQNCKEYRETSIKYKIRHMYTQKKSNSCYTFRRDDGNSDEGLCGPVVDCRRDPF